MEKAVAPHSSILAWKIPWMEEPGRLQSMGSQRVGHHWTTSLHFLHSLYTLSLQKEMATHSSVLAWRIPRTGEPGGLLSMVLHRVRHDWLNWTELRMKFNKLAAAAAAKSLQLRPTLCNPIDSSPPGSNVPGILQARILEWVAISFSNAWKWKVKVKSLSHVRLLSYLGIPINVT